LRFEASGTASHCRSRTRRATPGAARPLGGALRVRSDRVRPPLGVVCRTEPFLQPAAPRAAALTASVLAFPSPTVISPARHYLRCLRLRAANTSSPGASSVESRAYLLAVPAFALRGIRYRVPWQAPHPPRDLCQATRRCTPRPFRPRAPATRRGPSHRTVSPAGCAQGSRTYSVCARIPAAGGYFPGATLFCGVYVWSREHF